MQRADCTRKAQALGAEAVAELIDTSTGTSINRKEFNRLVQTVVDEHIDYVIIHKIDRFARGAFGALIDPPPGM